MVGSGSAAGTFLSPSPQLPCLNPAYRQPHLASTRWELQHLAPRSPFLLPPYCRSWPFAQEMPGERKLVLAMETPRRWR